MPNLPIRLPSSVYRYLVILIDMMIVWASGYFVYIFHLSDFAFVSLPSEYLILLLAGSVFLMIFSPRINLSLRFNGLKKIIYRITATWLAFVLLLVVSFFVIKISGQYSRIWFVGWTLATLFGLLIFRLCIFSTLRWIRSNGLNNKNLLVVGTGSSKNYVDKVLAESESAGIQKLANLEAEELPAWLDKYHVHGGVRIDEVWLCIPSEDQHSIHQALVALEYNTANIRIVPDFYSLKLINHGFSEVMGIPMFDLSASPLTGMLRLVKFLEDYILASLILCMISPLMLLISILIKITSPGPVFFKQLRHGWNGEEFWVYKFRTMYVHRESAHTVTQAKKNDCRITPLGMFLRRTSLDELPQFINVLQGNMSIVGPRPHAVEHNEHYKKMLPRYMLRHKVKPGITGWAQVSGYRGETDTIDKMQKRVEHDVYYIENISIWLDLKIIFMTVFKGFVNSKAY